MRQVARVVERGVARVARERDRQLAPGVHVAEEHVGHGVAALRSRLPRLENRRHVLGRPADRSAVGRRSAPGRPACRGRRSPAAAPPGGPEGRARSARPPRRSCRRLAHHGDHEVGAARRFERLLEGGLGLLLRLCRRFLRAGNEILEERRHVAPDLRSGRIRDPRAREPSPMPSSTVTAAGTCPNTIQEPSCRPSSRQAARSRPRS